VAVLFFMTIPGLAVILVALAALDRLGWWLRGRSGLPWYRDGHRPAPAAGLDEFQAVFHSSTRHVIERRRTELALRDDGHDGALPRPLTGPGGQPVVIRRVARRPHEGLWRSCAAVPVSSEGWDLAGLA
jgi:hypothetical protein